MLSQVEKRFVEKRERRARCWPIAGALALLLLAGYGAWLWVKMPHLIDPSRVVKGLESGALSESAMGVMVVMLPIVMDTLLVFALVVVLLWFVALGNEPRLIRLIRGLETEAAGGKGNG